jgi:hypothetical protein
MKEAWPEGAEFMVSMAKAFGKPSAVKIIKDGKTILEEGRCYG